MPPTDSGDFEDVVVCSWSCLAALMALGPRDAGFLAAHLNEPPARVATALTRLVREGLVRRRVRAGTSAAADTFEALPETPDG